MGHDLAAAVSCSLPNLRRYARALTGSQEAGDAMALAAIEALIAGPEADKGRAWSEADGRVAVFGALHRAWAAAGAPLGLPDSRVSARAQAHMAGLTPNSREALLLHAVEGFEPAAIGRVMGVPAGEAERLIDAAIREMEDSVRGRVLVIEDEAIIAMDISAIVREMGHRVTGVARTRAEAVRLASQVRPDLILADIQLADNSSGIDAVNDILAQFADLPVIFVTAFPERFLTGTRPEPAFLIAKPYAEEEVRSAVSQAMFFSSTETLAA